MTTPRRSAWARPASSAFEHPAGLLQAKTADERSERPALEVLHRDERGAFVLEVLVHRDDVGVAQRTGERDSRRNRSTTWVVGARRPASSFSATRRSRSVWRARYTPAIPPRPISRTISYRPTVRATCTLTHKR